MPVTGGASDKLGNSYEAYWTVKCMAQVLAGQAQAIRLEPPGEEGEGVEFWLQKDGVRQYHQVKRQQTGEGRWQLASLKEKKILTHFRQKLESDPNAECHFISTHSAYQLEELSSRARAATSWQEFEAKFINSNKWRTDFEIFRSHWANKPPSEAYEDLKRIFVCTIGEIPLKELVDSLLITLVEGNPEDVANHLAQQIPDNLHRELRAYDMWQLVLKNSSFKFQDYRQEVRILEAVKAQNLRYSRSIKDTAILGNLILRDEVGKVVDQLKTLPSPKQGVIVVGGAGLGKSSLLLQAIEVFQEEGWPVLSFRLDRLASTPLPKEVGRQLDLPDSPVEVQAKLANGRPALLVIDQLDAVSNASARQSSFFDCVQELFDQVSQKHPNLIVLTACRKFDLDNDHRLRRLAGDNGGIAVPVQLSHFSPERVREIVAEVGLDAAQLTTKQLELLTVPLHLGLLVAVAKPLGKAALDFHTLKDLLDHYREVKTRALRKRLNITFQQFDEALAFIADDLSAHQQLFIPVAKANRRLGSELLGALVSENVLVQDNGKYAFFHESFFDYAFAYNFVASDKNLLGMLLDGGEQHLFRRAQLRQILLHERDGDRDRYLRDLQALASEPRIRFHLKKVVFALLRELPDPSEEEWNIITVPDGIPATPDTQLTWSALFTSVAWFRLLDQELGLVEKWLSPSYPTEGYTDATIALMSTVGQQIPDRIAELAAKCYDATPQWQQRILRLARDEALLLNRPFFELFLKLIDDGVFTDKGNDFWHYLYPLVSGQPAWACEALGHYLPRWFDYVVRMAASTKTKVNNGFNENLFLGCAEKAPVEFVEQMLPLIIGLVEATLIKEEGQLPPWPDQIWPYGPSDMPVFTHDMIFFGVEKALAQIAEQTSEVFKEIEQKFNLFNLDYETIRYLLARVYAGGGQYFADRAVEYLCKFPGKLEIGNLSDGRRATRELLQAVTPYCSDNHLSRLEKVVLAYYPEWELRHRPQNYEGTLHGYAQYTMLSSIPRNRLSPNAQRRLAELQRKFGPLEPVKPSFRSGTVHSPISPETAAKLTDEQWLKAITRYENVSERNYKQDFFLGGAYELSNVLGFCAKKEPVRFAALILNISDEANPFYFEAILHGLTGANLDLAKALAVCERCHHLPQRPCGKAICDLIASYGEQDLPPTFIEMLGWYATQDPDPQVEVWRVDKQNPTEYYGGRIEDAGLNSVRGRAAGAMARLILANPQYVSVFLPYIRQMVNDPRISVKAWVAEVLVATLNYDRNLAVTLFNVLCKDTSNNEALLKTRTVEKFLSYAMWSHLSQVKPILEKMLASPLLEVMRAGTRLTCLLGLYQAEGRYFLEVCKNGTEIQRLGLADVLVRQIEDEKCQDLCQTYLIQLFQDESAQVRARAAECFDHLKGDKLSNFPYLIEKFVDSLVFNEHYGELIRALEQTTAKLPDLTCLVCEHLLTSAGGSVGDITTEVSYHVHTLSQLIIRIYEQTSSPDIKKRCLDLLDQLLQKRVYALEELLEGYNRG